MQKLKRNVSKKKIAVIVFIILIGGIFICRRLIPQEEIITLQSEEVERRTIANSISATGTITTNSSKTITSTLQGTEVKTVNVSEGDYVKQGDIICEFDVESIENNIKTLEENINDLEEQKKSSKKEETTVKIELTELESQINEAQREYDDAKKAYEDKCNEVENLTSPDDKFDEISKNYDEKYSAYAASEAAYYEQSEVLNQKQQEYDKYFSDGQQIDDEGNPINKENYKLENYATKEHKKAYDDYTEAQNKLNELEKDVKEKEKALNDYQETYDEILDEMNNFDSKKNQLEQEKNEKKALMELKKSKLDTLKSSYETAKNTSNSLNAITDSFSSMSDMSSTIDTNIKSLKSQKETLEKQIEKSVITAPIDGIITSIGVSEGTTYMGTNIAKIENAEAFSIEAFIDEYDIPDIKEGMKVLIKTDATRDEELEGEIFDIAETAHQGSTASFTGNSGAAVYKIKIKINDDNERLRLGMNARLSIVTNMLEDVITVPYNSIHEEDDKKYVEITTDNETSTKIYVETGLEGNYYVEITSENIEEGMKVVIPDAETGTSIDDLINQMGNAGGLN